MIEIVNVEDRSVVTSGSDKRYFICEGKRYSHIIDPRRIIPQTITTP